MNIEEMQKLYKSGKYFLIRKKIGVHTYEVCERSSTNLWKDDILSEQEKIDMLKYKLIHEKHKDILYAYLVDDQIGIEFKSENWVLCDDDWIDIYDENTAYRLEYIIAMEDGLGNSYQIDISDTNGKNDIIRTDKEDISKESLDRISKHFPHEKSEDIFIRNGFEIPVFECEILKVIQLEGQSWTHFIGYIKFQSMNEIMSGYWDSDGKFMSGRANYKEFNLTIRKKWYEFEGNLPSIVRYRDTIRIAVEYVKEEDRLYFDNNRGQYSDNAKCWEKIDRNRVKIKGDGDE